MAGVLSLVVQKSMSLSQWADTKPTPDYAVSQRGNEDYYWGMGLTAEAVANNSIFLVRSG
jgi:acetyl-CoA acyltransferase